MRANRFSRYKFMALFGVILLALLAPPLSAQDAGAAASGQEQRFKVLRVRAEDAGQIAVLLENFDVMVRRSSQLGLITIAGLPENVARAEEAVHEIERLTMRTPASTAQDVELTVHFLGIAQEDGPLPSGALSAVVEELKKTFPFRGYELLETIVLRARVGERSGVNGLLPEVLGEGVPPKQYAFESHVAAIEPRQSAQVVRFESVRAQITLRTPQGVNQFERIEISTALEVPDGKTVVVGKAGSVGESQGYMLVLTAKVVQ